MQARWSQSVFHIYFLILDTNTTLFPILEARNKTLREHRRYRHHFVVSSQCMPWNDIVRTREPILSSHRLCKHIVQSPQVYCRRCIERCGTPGEWLSEQSSCRFGWSSRLAYTRTRTSGLDLRNCRIQHQKYTPVFFTKC